MIYMNLTKQCSDYLERSLIYRLRNTLGTKLNLSKLYGLSNTLQLIRSMSNHYFKLVFY